MDDSRYGSDAQLVEGLRGREAAAQEAFVDRYMPLILGRLRRVMRPAEGTEPDELQDVALDVAARPIESVSGTKPVTNLRALVARTAFNAGIDWYRRQKSRREQEADDELSEIVPDAVASDARDDREVREADYVPINPEAASIFAQALATLEPEEQRLLQLRAAEISYDEIALMLRDEGNPVKEATWRKRHELVP